MNALAELLYHRWIVKAKDPEKYFAIRDEIQGALSFIREKLGYQLIITPQLIKLEKVPANVQTWMGIQAFESAFEYQLFVLILMYLEDLTEGEQFILSELTAFLQQHYPDGGLAWESYTHRRLLIRVMKYCLEEGLIILNDGQESAYLTDETQDVLYESTGLSRYYMLHFNHAVTDLASLEPFNIENHRQVLQEDRGIIRRQRVYRRLILELGVDMLEGQEDDFVYLKNYRSVIEEDFQRELSADVFISKNVAFLVSQPDQRFSDSYPNQSALSQVVLRVNRLLRRQAVLEEALIPDNNDHLYLPLHDYLRIVEQVKELDHDKLTKALQTMTTKAFVEAVMQEMQRYGLIEIGASNQEVIISPICGKFIGFYESYGKGDETTDD